MPLKRRQSYSMRMVGGWTTFDPVDATTYYTGAYPAVISTAASNHKLFVPRNGIMREVDLTCFAADVPGSGEDWTMYLRLNNTTDHLIAVLGSTSSRRRWRTANINLPVTTADYVEVKFTTPTWVTNPEGCLFWGHILVDY